MEKIEIFTEYITLGQFLKIADLIESGGEAKVFLKENQVYVNDIQDNRRGRKLRDSDVIRIMNQEFIIKRVNVN